MVKLAIIPINVIIATTVQFQHPSMLDFQRKMQEERQRNNLTSIFRVKEIPSDTQIKTLLDHIEPDDFASVFNGSL
ncbi:MAG: hypothetical protein LBH43_11820 [Treponema sp.]|nr:hypothetical protein [Treponema sp.]